MPTTKRVESLNDNSSCGDREWDQFCTRIYLARRAAEKAAAEQRRIAGEMS